MDLGLVRTRQSQELRRQNRGRLGVSGSGGDNGDRGDERYLLCNGTGAVLVSPVLDLMRRFSPSLYSTDGQFTLIVDRPRLNARSSVD